VEKQYYTLSVSAALVIQQAKRMRRIIVTCGLFGSAIFFSHYLINRPIFGKVIEHKMY
jgi:hypothetical protein